MANVSDFVTPETVTLLFTVLGGLIGYKKINGKQVDIKGTITKALNAKLQELLSDPQRVEDIQKTLEAYAWEALLKIDVPQNTATELVVHTLVNEFFDRYVRTMQLKLNQQMQDLARQIEGMPERLSKVGPIVPPLDESHFERVTPGSIEDRPPTVPFTGPFTTPLSTFIKKDDK